MTDYLHGAYGKFRGLSNKSAAQSKSAFVYVGTAPVNTIKNGKHTANTPLVIRNMAEAKKLLGYSDNWAGFTLCEAMEAHLNKNGVGPLIMINVLNPYLAQSEEQVSASLTPENGRILIADAEKIYLDSIEVATKTAGADYTTFYDAAKKTVVIEETTPASLGAEALTVTYYTIDMKKVTAKTVIGEDNGKGSKTGLYAIENVYELTGYVPSFLAAPGYSSVPEIHEVMKKVSQKIGGHWDAYMLVDLPIVTDPKAKIIEDPTLNMDAAAEWKKKNGYNAENETVYYPMAEGTDGKKYHLSVLAAANLNSLLVAQDGIPYKSASNTPVDIARLYLGEDNRNKVYTDTMINELLNKNGIASAAYVSGRWAIWGAHSANYLYNDDDPLNDFETARMMLFYISNDFQNRRGKDVDAPMTINDLRSIAAQEQSRLDALVKIGALTYGEARFDGSLDSRSDMIQGDFYFTFDLTTTPLAKSLNAVARWTDKGFVTYFENNF